MVARLEVERRRLADELDRHRVVLRVAVRRVLGRRVRHAVEQRLQRLLRLGELGLERLQPLLHAAQLLELLRRRLALQLRASRAAPRPASAARACARRPRAARRRRRPRPCARARRGSASGSWRAARRSIIGFESRSASSTCATPSSSADGHTQRATAFTRSCAFATAIAVVGPLDELEVVLAVAERDRLGLREAEVRGEEVHARRPSSRPPARTRGNAAATSRCARGRRTAPSSAARARRARRARRRTRASSAARRASRAAARPTWKSIRLLEVRVRARLGRDRSRRTARRRRRRSGE